MAAHSSDRIGKRRFLVEVEDPRRIDQGRDEDCGRSAAAAVAQRGATHSCDFTSRRAPWRTLGPLISRKPLKRRSGEVRLLLRHQPDHFQEQRQRPGGAFMLQCTKLR